MPRTARRSSMRMASAFEPAPSSPEVHILDDDVTVRRSISRLLGAAGIATRTYDSALEFLDGAEDIGAGCVITALWMGDIDGFELMRRLTDMGVRNPVIMISAHGDIPKAVEAMKAGARDFIEKPLNEPLLLGAVRAAISADAQENHRADTPLGGEDLLSLLSPREQHVLHGVIAGQGNKVIARELGISPRTVETHPGQCHGQDRRRQPLGACADGSVGRSVDVTAARRSS